MIVKCTYCGKKIKRKPLLLKKFKHSFCTKDCHNKWMKEKGPRGKEHPLYKKIEIKCECCGEVKIRERKQYRKSNHHFCSQECHLKWMRDREPYNYARVKTNCDFCGKQILVKQCHFETYNHHFCNSNCFGGWKSKNWSGANSVFWKGGISFKPYSNVFNKKFKAFIRQRDNFTCQLCNTPENGQAHICHHIDYDKKNSNPDNLLLLCRSCNSKVNYNRGHWIDYFKAGEKIYE